MNRCLFLLGVLSVTLFHLTSSATIYVSASKAQESKKASTSNVGNWYATQWGKSLRPSAGVVPDEKAAATIAEAVLTPIYGEKQIQGQKPFKVSLKDNIWLIEGVNDPPAPAGTFVLRLSKVDGRVLFISHSQ
jgi:hypothetical protein